MVEHHVVQGLVVNFDICLALCASAFAAGRCQAIGLRGPACLLGKVARGDAHVTDKGSAWLYSWALAIPTSSKAKDAAKTAGALVAEPIDESSPWLFRRLDWILEPGERYEGFPTDQFYTRPGNAVTVLTSSRPGCSTLRYRLQGHGGEYLKESPGRCRFSEGIRHL